MGNLVKRFCEVKVEYVGIRAFIDYFCQYFIEPCCARLVCFIYPDQNTDLYQKKVEPGSVSKLYGSTTLVSDTGNRFLTAEYLAR